MDILEIVRGLAVGGTPIETAHELIRTLANANGCVPDVDWALREAEAIYATKGRRGVMDEVREYVTSASGWFTYRDIDSELQYVTSQDKTNRRVALHRLVSDGLVERNRAKAGMFRRKETDIEIVDWRNADMRELDIHWPFGLEEWEITYPGTLDVIAGSSGAGKTAYCLNFLVLNQANHMVRYMTSEMSPHQLGHRLTKLNPNPDSWAFEAIRCSRDFADKILPDSLNIIDYLEVDGEHPSGVVNEMRDIFDALKTGFALIALQKKGNTVGYTKKGDSYTIRNELGRGGAFSMEKARLYLSMDYNELSVVKASNRRNDDDEPLKGKRWHFSLYRGCIFEDVYPLFQEGE